ncbi:Uma2 family endonuclease [Streptomyces sp. NPDC023723]|uniref:Uma2 family endonuclease n=1 Tax=Streptomyces sp. NPDC023723 TaxID=3154323 RepID=UPI0033F1260F
MTVLADRIEMAEESGELTLDVMFEWLATLPVPEGTKVEIIGGNIFMSPQRRTHFEIIFRILQQLNARYSVEHLASDVRIDFPGRLNGFACDVAAIADGSVESRGRWRYQDVEFVAEVISKDTAANDYGPKKDTYATAGVPVYLIVDPYTGQWHLHTLPKDGTYHGSVSFGFGEDIDLTDSPVGLVLKTDGFPRD